MPVKGRAKKKEVIPVYGEHIPEAVIPNVYWKYEPGLTAAGSTSNVYAANTLTTVSV